MSCPYLCFLAYHCVHVGYIEADTSEEVGNGKHNEDPIIQQVHVGHLSQRLGRERVAATPNGRTTFAIVGFIESGLVGNVVVVVARDATTPIQRRRRSSFKRDRGVANGESHGGGRRTLHQISIVALQNAR